MLAIGLVGGACPAGRKMRLGSVAGAQGLCVNRRPQVPVMVMKAGGWTVLSEMFQVFELSSRLHHTTVVERSDFDATAPNVTAPPGRVECGAHCLTMDGCAWHCCAGGCC